MRTKVVSFFIFFQELSNKNKIGSSMSVKIKALRPKMTKIASRGWGDHYLSAVHVNGQCQEHVQSCPCHEHAFPKTAAVHVAGVPRSCVPGYKAEGTYN